MMSETKKSGDYRVLYYGEWRIIGSKKVGYECHQPPLNFMSQFRRARDNGKPLWAPTIDTVLSTIDEIEGSDV
tara:strand:- start:393 stop:611 length:219 start_codon:yes stop_codon:yes gene_type:complete